MEAALDQPVLVLNRLWQAVNVIGARRAFGLLARGHAHVVHQQEDDFRMFSMMDWIDFSADNPPVVELETVHTPTRTIRLPRVILLTFFDKLPVQGAQAHAQQRLRARQELLPVLRPGPSARAAEPRPRDPARLRREDHLGEHRLLLHPVQHAQVQPASPRGRHAPHPQARPARSGGRSSRWCSATSTARSGRTSSTSPTGTSSWRSDRAALAARERERDAERRPGGARSRRARCRRCGPGARAWRSRARAPSRPACPVRKESKIRSRIASGMPEPVSTTSRTAQAAGPRAVRTPAGS